MRLLRASVIARRISVSVAVCFELDVRGASHLVCHRWFGSEDNIWGMVADLRICEYPFLDSLVD